MEDRVDVLILTASFGNGHNSATQAILEDIIMHEPQLKVRSVDLFDITTPKLKEYFTGTYQILTKNQPAIYNRLYDLRTKTPNNALDSLMVQLTFERFKDYVESVSPKMIISVFPTGAAFASYYRENYDKNVKLITCITDVVDSWEWIYPNTDLYFVASLTVKKRLMFKNISEENILVTGVPVRRKFKEIVNTNSAETKKIRHLLIIGNAMESVRLNKKFLEKLSKLKNTRTTIVTGKQKTLYHKLVRMNKWDNIDLVGYTEHLEEYMAQSDLIISKAGGATIFEAIEMELPILVQHSCVGQENCNVEFVKEAGIGELVQDADSLYNKLVELFKNKRSIQYYRKNIRNFKKTLNPDQIAPQIINLLSESERTGFRVS